MMKRDELFDLLEQIGEETKDRVRILSNLHYTHYVLMDRYRKVLEPYTLTITQSNVLGILTYNSPTPLSLEDIKSMMLEPNSDVSRIVSRLVVKGFAEKVVNPANKRKRSIAATEKGHEIMMKLDKDPAFFDLVSSVSTPEARTFAGVLKKMRESR
jgi:DNA-binding MarR family transcriptional regulator